MIGSVALSQFLFSIPTLTPAFGAWQATHHCIGAASVDLNCNCGRNMRFIAGLLLVLVIGNASEAFAQDLRSANYLLPACRDFASDTPHPNSDPFLRGVCAGIIRGLVQVDGRTCVPEGVKVGQIMRVVLLYIDNQPARHHEDFVKLALEAIRNAWPCNVIR
jgi:hypothetical protein